MSHHTLAEQPPGTSLQDRAPAEARGDRTFEGLVKGAGREVLSTQHRTRVRREAPLQRCGVSWPLHARGPVSTMLERQHPVERRGEQLSWCERRPTEH